MARHSEVIFYASRKAYMTTYRGHRYTLQRCRECDKPAGPNYLAALAAFQAILAAPAAPTYEDDTVGACLERWCVRKELASKTNGRILRSLLVGALQKFRRVPVSSLAGHHVLSFIDAQGQWGPCTRYHAFRAFKDAMIFATSSGSLLVNPIAKLRCPNNYFATSRGADFVLPVALVELLLDQAKGPFQDYLTVLSRTGARPGEIAHAEHYHYRPAIHALYYEANPSRGYVHKTARRRKRGQLDRVIYLDDQTEAIAARNAKRRGVLFPNEKGEEFSTASLCKRIKWLRETGAVKEWLTDHNHDPAWVVPYSFRHTWITRALQKGVAIATVADLCGNSVAMIERHYSHATADTAGMRRAFLSAL